MSDIDHSLIDHARKYVTGENVHFVKTWIFCYETSELDSPTRERYEKLLREFVTSNRLIEASRIKIQNDREHLTLLGRVHDERDRID